MFDFSLHAILGFFGQSVQILLNAWRDNFQNMSEADVSIINDFGSWAFFGKQDLIEHLGGAIDSMGPQFLEFHYFEDLIIQGCFLAIEQWH